MIGEFWDSIPAWLIFGIVGAALVGAFFFIRAANMPLLTFWLLLGGVGVAVIIGLVRAAIGGGGGV